MIPQYFCGIDMNYIFIGALIGYLCAGYIEYFLSERFLLFTYFSHCDDMYCVWFLRELQFFFIGGLTGYRAEVADMVRQAVLLQPELAFNFAKQWLETTICKPIDTGNRIFYCDQNTLVHVEIIHLSFEFL